MALNFCINLNKTKQKCRLYPNSTKPDSFEHKTCKGHKATTLKWLSVSFTVFFFFFFFFFCTSWKFRLSLRLFCCWQDFFQRVYLKKIYQKNLFSQGFSCSSIKVYWSISVKRLACLTQTSYWPKLLFSCIGWAKPWKIYHYCLPYSAQSILMKIYQMLLFSSGGELLDKHWI